MLLSKMDHLPGAGQHEEFSSLIFHIVAGYSNSRG